MARFRYKMQSILNIKLSIEAQKKIAYTLVQIELNEAEEKLNSIETEKLNYQEELRDLMGRKLDILEMKRCSSAIKTLENLIDIQLNCIEKIKVRLEKSRVELNKAMIERKTHEKLRENAFQEFLIEVEKDEKKAVDELISYKYNGSNGDK
ncbi:MAG: hypothetical protein K0R15_1167 [Clostridiales bacterium]|jgi:flagellar FliJ protein|nr:hypothetical protein [Clostridiales bacterium]